MNMNFFNRAIRYCLRHKARSLILFLTFSLFSCAALTALSIGHAAIQKTAELKETVGGAIRILLDEDGHYDSGTQSQWGTTYQYTGDYITDDVISAVSEVDGVVSCNGKDSDGYWGAAVDFAYFPSAFNISYTPYGAAVPYNVLLNSELDASFLNGTYTLEEGRHITPEDSYVVMISKELADKNGLSIGDKITMYSLDLDMQGKDAENTFQIVGIFSGTEGMTKEAVSPDQIPANCGYMDVNSLNDMWGETETTFSALDVYISSAENARQILNEIQALPELKGKTFTYEINNESFDLISHPLSSLQRMVGTAVFFITAISAAVVTLLLILWTRSRKKEAGILLSIGRSKGEIIGQFLTENLLLAIFSFAASGTLAVLLSGEAGAFFINRISGENPAPAVTVSVSDMAAVFGCGALILCFAVFAASYTIIRLKPKDILEKML